MTDLNTTTPITLNVNEHPTQKGEQNSKDVTS